MFAFHALAMLFNILFAPADTTVIHSFGNGLAGVRAANPDVHTSYADLKEGAWQAVRFAFAEMKPNAYFQPPDAKKGSAIDVSDVAFIAFAPQDQTAGRLVIGKFVVER
jgi:hypothetical protein